MKIAILADPLDNQSAGVHTYTKQLIWSLVEEDDENEYLIIREKKDPNLPLSQIEVPNIRLPIGFASLRLFFIIPFVLRFHNVDAVLEPAHFGPFNLPKRVKRITMIHDLTPILMSEYHRYHSQLLQRIFLKRILKKADLILSNSENTSNDIRKVYPFTSSKISTILLGRDEDFHPVASKVYMDKKGIAHPYFLSTGTIEPRKNLNLLLDAYSSFREQCSETVLLILAGKKGWKSESFFDALENHPYRKDIILTGYVEKVHLVELYSHALSLIYPSLYEGFGLPVLEGLSCGTRVICSNTSSLPEVGGDVADYIDPHDQLALTNLLLASYDTRGDRHLYADKRIAHALTFSWKKHALKFMDVIKNKL